MRVREDLFVWRKSPKFQNGMNFPVVAPCPQFSQTVGPPVDELCPLSPLTRAGSRGGSCCQVFPGTGSCCQVFPGTSIQPFPVCHRVVGDVEQLTPHACDCFLVLAFSFIYYSFFLLVVDVCKSPCFELRREHWA